MGAKEEKAQEYTNEMFNAGLIDSSEEFDKISDGFEAGWHAAMEYLYKMQPTDAWKEIIKEVKGE